MRLNITVTTQDGESNTYVASPPEWAKWETKTGFTIRQVQEKMGINDLMFLGWHAMKRESGGKPVKPYDIWCEQIADISVGDVDPKAISQEA
jgi:hypothetical protein